MGKIEMVKAAGQIVVSFGVGAVVSNVIKTTTPADVSKIGKVLVGVGALVISSMATDKATDYVEEKFDETVKSIKEAFTSEDAKDPIEE